MSDHIDLTPLDSTALARFMLLAGRRIRLHTFRGQSGADMSAELIQRYARDRGAWLVEAGSFADCLGHQVAVQTEEGLMLCVEVTRAEIGLDDGQDRSEDSEDDPQQTADW